MNSNAIQKLITAISVKRLGALFLNNQANITYLTGFASRDSGLLLVKEDYYFITDSRYEEEAKSFFPKNKVRIISESFFAALAGVIREKKLKRLGFEAKSLFVAQLNKIKDNLPKINLIPTVDLVESLRQIKSEDEITKIRQAIQKTGSALKAIKNSVKTGITEAALAAELEYRLKKSGARGSAFETIVAFGKNASMPHHITSEKKLGRQEAVLIDTGAGFQGYNSDITRTFKRGCKNREFLKAYDAVMLAQEKAFSMIKPGAVISAIDRSARGLLHTKGFGKFFGHSLGHGVGLEVHELPGINCRNNGKLDQGMIFTVEPGIYIPGRFGIRIEDMVRVTEHGCEILSRGMAS